MKKTLLATSLITASYTVSLFAKNMQIIRGDESLTTETIPHTKRPIHTEKTISSLVISDALNPKANLEPKGHLNTNGALDEINKIAFSSHIINLCKKNWQICAQSIEDRFYKTPALKLFAYKSLFDSLSKAPDQLLAFIESIPFGRHYFYSIIGEQAKNISTTKIQQWLVKLAQENEDINLASFALTHRQDIEPLPKFLTWLTKTNINSKTYTAILTTVLSKLAEYNPEKTLNYLKDKSITRIIGQGISDNHCQAFWNTVLNDAGTNLIYSSAPESVFSIIPHISDTRKQLSLETYYYQMANNLNSTNIWKALPTPHIEIDKNCSPPTRASEKITTSISQRDIRIKPNTIDNIDHYTFFNAKSLKITIHAHNFNIRDIVFVSNNNIQVNIENNFAEISSNNNFSLMLYTPEAKIIKINNRSG